jgi:hypothetical protein
MNPMMRFFALVLSKLNGGYDVQIVDSMDEALIVLKRLDPELSQGGNKSQSNGSSGAATSP